MLHLIRSPKDWWAGAIYVIVGAAALIIGRDYDMGTARRMGPAYFPYILSGMLIAVGCVAILRGLFAKGGSVGRFGLRGLLLVTSSIVLFGVMLRGAGLVIALPVFVILSSFASASFRWRDSLLLAAGITLFCILVFQKGLGVPLPLIGSWFGD
jgi:putative tricarboxylic transport membrane protein